MQRATRSGIGGLVLGNDFQALGVVRSLAQHHVPVFVLSHEPGIARYSRFCRGASICGDLLREDAFCDRLVETASAHGLEGWVLYPNSDETVTLTSRCRDVLMRHFLVPTPKWQVTRQFIDKQLAYNLAASVGLPIPRQYPSGSVEEVLAASPAFPLVLKPALKERFFQIARCKALRADNPGELAARFAYMAAIVGPAGIVVQEMIEGGPRNLYSYAVFFDGTRIVAGLAGHRMRQHPMDFGQATTYAETVNLPQLHEPTERVLAAMGFYGIAEVEYMFDERTGQFKFIEINGRPWGWHTLAKAAGLNMPYMLFCHMTGRLAPATERRNARWIRMLTDLPTAVGEVARGNLPLSTYLRQLASPKECAVFSWRDPLPSLVELFYAPYLLHKRGF